jgi:hypothetical protein
MARMSAKHGYLKNIKPTNISNRKLKNTNYQNTKNNKHRKLNKDTTTNIKHIMGFSNCWYSPVIVGSFWYLDDRPYRPDRPDTKIW